MGKDNNAKGTLGKDIEFYNDNENKIESVYFNKARFCLRHYHILRNTRKTVVVK